MKKFISGPALGGFSNIVMGAALLSANAGSSYAPPPDATIALFGKNALFGPLPDASKSAAKAIIAQLHKDIAENWQDWAQSSNIGPGPDRDHAMECLDQVLPNIRLPAKPGRVSQMDGNAFADLMVAHAAQIMPQAYGAGSKADPKTQAARQILWAICLNTFRHAIEIPAFSNTLVPSVTTGIQGQLQQLNTSVEHAIETQNSRFDALENLLMATLHANGQDGAARDSGLTEKALMRLAARIAGDVSTPQQAIRELEHAVDLAVSVQQNSKGAAGGSDPVLERVVHLSADGDHTDAAAILDQELARQEADHRARTTQLLSAALQQDILRRDAAGAAARLVKLSDMKVDSDGTFADLCATWMEWFAKGRDEGLLIDLQIAEELARALQSRAMDMQQRGQALNFLGIMCHMRGEREVGVPSLLAAVAAFEDAQLYWGRAQFPELWAKAQMNLANSQHALAMRDPGNDRLERAIEAYEKALEIRNQTDDPAGWAVTQMNLCTALRTLAEMNGDADAARQSLAAIDATLKVRTKQADPAGWATSTMNRGMSLRVLGETENAPTPINHAIKDLDQAAQYWASDKAAFFLAITHQQLGLCALALWDQNPARRQLDRARTFFQTALDGLSDDGAPVDRLVTAGHEALTRMAIAQLDNEPDQSTTAQLQLESAITGLLDLGHLRGAQQLRHRADAMTLADETGKAKRPG